MQPPSSEMVIPRRKQSRKTLQAAFDTIHKLNTLAAPGKTISIQQKVRFAGKTTLYVPNCKFDQHKFTLLYITVSHALFRRVVKQLQSWPKSSRPLRLLICCTAQGVQRPLAVTPASCPSAPWLTNWKARSKLAHWVRIHSSL